MRKLVLSATVALSLFTFVGCSNAKATNADAGSGTKIQVAILLDTSNSMDGLIEQAKSRLWNVVNTLTTLKYRGKTPRIEIALFEYGNDRIASRDRYIRQVAPLTTDLDLISEKLFALTTNGGQEYCGAVIEQAVRSLEWSKNDADMKLIYIAGNEPFTQGPVDYKAAISAGVNNGIYVNTILCSGQWGGTDGWEDGARLGKGKFFVIDHNARIRHYQTPYDSMIEECNVKLNDTYVSYTKTGKARKLNQLEQDKNAKSLSGANYAERVVSKSSKAYTNESWDLVDMVSRSEKALDNINEAELSEEFQGKSKDEVKAIATRKKHERETIQAKMADLAKQRQAYIDELVQNDAGDSADDLGKAINQSVIDLAITKGYEVKK